MSIFLEFLILNKKQWYKENGHFMWLVIVAHIYLLTLRDFDELLLKVLKKDLKIALFQRFKY